MGINSPCSALCSVGAQCAHRCTVHKLVHTQVHKLVPTHRCTLTEREVALGGAFKLAHENSWRLYPDCTSISLPCIFFARILIFPSFAAANVHTRKLHKAMSMSTRATLDKMHMQMMSIIMLPIDFRSKCHCQTIFNYSV